MLRATTSRLLLPSISPIRLLQTRFTSTTSTSTSTCSTTSKRLEAFIYFDSIFPIKLGIWDLRSIITNLDEKALLEQTRSLIPLDSIYSLEVESISPRQKDGGAFVKFTFIPPLPPYEDISSLTPEELKVEKDKVLKIVEQEVRNSILSRGVKPWFNWRKQGRAFLVKGVPFLEDMHRFPNSTIRVEFEGPDIPQEELYSIFRPYGHIRQILPASPNSKDLPHFATIIYTSIRSATSARNALHSSLVSATSPLLTSGTTSTSSTSVSPTLLRILYSERTQAHHIRDWAKDHPRLFLPVVIFVIGVLSYSIFDPIRAFFIKAKVKGTFDAKQKFLGWLRKETLGRLGLSETLGVGNNTGIEKEREEAKEKVQAWLRDAPDTFILVVGPRGSGKSSLIEEVVQDRDDVLTIDCDVICKNARDDTKLVSELAAAIGYAPSFALGASLNNLIDLASVATIGVKAGFSSSLDVQLKALLEVAATALKDIAASNIAKSEKESKRLEKIKKAGILANANNNVVQVSLEGSEPVEGSLSVRDGRLDVVSGIGPISELGMGIEKPIDNTTTLVVGPESKAIAETVIKLDPTNSHPELIKHARSVGMDLPVIIVKGFAAKHAAESEGVLFDVLAEWAALLVENQIAHVIFTSDAVTPAKSLAKALPSKPFLTISLNDASSDAAEEFVTSKLAELDQETLSTTTKASIALLGGRQEDLQLLVQKIKGGLTAENAVEDIITRNAIEMRKNFFGDDREEAKGLKWTRSMAWTLVKGLVKEDEEVKYAEVLINPPFKGDEAALRALEQAELITVHHRNGRPSIIRPGKPVYRSSFSRLLEDKVFAASIEYEISEKSIKSAEKEFNEASSQLIELSKLFGGPNGNARWIFGGGTTLPKEIAVRVDMLLKEMKVAEEKIEKHEAKKAVAEKILKEES